MTDSAQISPGWRDDGLEEAVEIISAIPRLNAVLERESALLAQNLVSAIVSRNHEDQVATVANNQTKAALARSMLVGLQGGTAEIARLRAALKPFALNVGAVSLSRALGHITREDLLCAKDAYEQNGDRK